MFLVPPESSFIILKSLITALNHVLRYFTSNSTRFLDRLSNYCLQTTPMHPAYINHHSDVLTCTKFFRYHIKCVKHTRLCFTLYYILMHMFLAPLIKLMSTSYVKTSSLHKTINLMSSLALN